MVTIAAHVVIKHDRDNNTATVLGVFNKVESATDAIIAVFEETRRSMGAKSLSVYPDSILVDYQTDDDVIWVDDLGWGVRGSQMPAVNFSITKTTLQEA